MPQQLPRISEGPASAGSAASLSSSSSDILRCLANTTLAKQLKEHYLTHYPKHPGCEACQLAKAQKTRHSRVGDKDRTHSDPPVEFGDLIMADHLVLNERDQSHDAKRVSLTCYDRATMWLESTPCVSKGMATTRAALRYFAGTTNPELFYSDNSGELKAAALSLEWRHDTSTENRPASNGVIERQNRAVLEGARCALYECGLEHRFWSQAMITQCFLNNTSRKGDKDSLTPWQRRFGAKQRFEGKLVSFGAKVHYLLTADREVQQRQKLAPKMVEGLFAGYKTHTDGKWRGECKVYDRVSYENWKGIGDLPIHVTKELYLPGTTPDSRDQDEFQFPVRDGDWKSMAPSLSRYKHRRYAKPAKRGAKPTEVSGGNTADDEAKADTAGADSSESSAAFPDMFDDLLRKVKAKHAVMNGDEPSEAISEEPNDTEPAYPPDIWVRSGEFIIRKHYKPRDTLFSPIQ